MTVSTRTSAPSYKIFEPDALDQIYAKGALDPLMGGFAGSLALSHGANKAGHQEQYLASQEKFNRMAATLDAMEMDSKSKQEAMKIAGNLIAKGEDPTLLQGGGDIYNNAGQNLLPGMLRNKIAAETAAAGRSGAKEPQEKTTVISLTPTGSVNVERKGNYGQTGGNVPTEPNRSGSTPTTPVAKDTARIVAHQAVTILGPNAVPKADSAGNSVWTSPDKPGIVLKFDSKGNMSRGQ